MLTLFRQIFRAEKGTATNDTEAGIRLQLQDFATEALGGSDRTLTDPICIPAHTLYSYLDQAEQNVAMLK